METSLHCVWHLCAQWDPSQRVYQPSWAAGRLTAKFPLRCCGHPSPPSTLTNATAIIYTDTHVHTLPETVIYPYTQFTTEQGLVKLDFRGINKLLFSLEIWPDVDTQTVMSPCYLVFNNQGKKMEQGTYSRANCIMYESGSMISTSAKMFPSIFQFKSCTIQGFVSTRELYDLDV